METNKFSATTINSLSVFFPAYNEEGNIASTVEKAIKVLKDLKINRWEVIVVDDGSTDKTGEVADELAKKYSEVRVIHQPNGGYGTALRAGFYNAKYDYIVYTDSDGQFDFAEVDKFLEKAKDYDLVIGYRIKRRDPFFRLVNAKGWKMCIFLLFGLWLKDVDCGFKLVKKKVIEKIPKLESSRGGMINAEIVLKAEKCGFRVAQVGVHHYPRYKGSPTGASLKVIVQSFIDLVKLRWKLS